jgi:hypothetical protein
MTLCCLWCDEPVKVGDELARFPIGTPDGVRVEHYECSLRRVVGGINHQRGQCTCCGGKLPPDPEGMSRREAARLAAHEYLRHNNA